jgi:hypothetical protein
MTASLPARRTGSRSEWLVKVCCVALANFCPVAYFSAGGFTRRPGIPTDLSMSGPPAGGARWPTAQADCGCPKQIEVAKLVGFRGYFAGTIAALLFMASLLRAAYDGYGLGVYAAYPIAVMRASSANCLLLALAIPTVIVNSWSGRRLLTSADRRHSLSDPVRPVLPASADCWPDRNTDCCFRRADRGGHWRVHQRRNGSRAGGHWLPSTRS